VQVEDVVAVQRGTDKAGPVIIIQAHIDSRVSDIMNATADAPGANDDGSGVALVLEAARQLTMQKLPATLVYAILSGEEQGLWGGKLLADTARARGWKVAAVLNNDIVGNSHGIGGEFLPHRVRVFSAGGPDSDDTPSRALAKAVKQIAAAKPDIGLEVVAIRRADRIQRGGDHLPFLEGGFPAVRFTEAAEHYDHQHQDVRTEKGKAYGDTIDAMDFAYLARVTALNVRVVGTLARAPAPPAAVSIAGAVSDDTQISWSDVRGAAGYRIYWRRADGFDWTNHRDVPAMTTTLVLKAVNIDDNVFGVAARSSGGEASLVSFAKPAEHRP
jgi:Zn-dependent M28 family amino/carboxypeptidase